MLHSVFLPTRNRPFCVETAVASVLAQTSRDWQLVILDNSDTPYWPGRLPWRDERIVYRHELCCGVADASTKAIRLCDGDILVPLGDDDRLPPDCLATSAALIGGHDWLNGRTAIHTDDGTIVTYRGGDQDSIDRTLSGDYWLGGAVHWRRHLTLEHGYETAYESAADYRLYLRFLQHSRPALTDHTMYLYRDWAGTDSREHAGRQADATARIASQLRGDLMRNATVHAPAASRRGTSA